VRGRNSIDWIFLFVRWQIATLKEDSAISIYPDIFTDLIIDQKGNVFVITCDQPHIEEFYFSFSHSSSKSHDNCTRDLRTGNTKRSASFLIKRIKTTFPRKEKWDFGIDRRGPNHVAEKRPSYIYIVDARASISRMKRNVSRVLMAYEDVAAVALN
jgi:hypothetical protein